MEEGGVGVVDREGEDEPGVVKVWRSGRRRMRRRRRGRDGCGSAGGGGGGGGSRSGQD